MHWQFGIGGNDGYALRDASDGSEIDSFLSFATGLELDDAIREMISLFRDAAKWLEKYAPEEVPPPTFREKVAAALRTFLGKVFPALKQADEEKMLPVVEKAEKKHLPDNSEPSEKVASDETPTDTAADSGESPRNFSVFC